MPSATGGIEEGMKGTGVGAPVGRGWAGLEGGRLDGRATRERWTLTWGHPHRRSHPHLHPLGRPLTVLRPRSADWPHAQHVALGSPEAPPVPADPLSIMLPFQPQITPIQALPQPPLSTSSQTHTIQHFYFCFLTRPSPDRQTAQGPRQTGPHQPRSETKTERLRMEG